MLEIKNWKSMSQEEQRKCLTRAQHQDSFLTVVEEIIRQVRTGGDKELIQLTKALEGVDLESIQVPLSTINQAQVDSNTQKALEQAIANLTQYQQSLLPENTTVEMGDGLSLTTVYQAIQRVGLYVPGGNNTPLISSVLMTAIPAKVAGCPIKVLCTPPDKNGCINPSLLFAAKLCGIDQIYTIGGAQAIAAMAYGTESVPKVDKLFGPGNQYVTTAKTLVATDPNGATIDLPAGPSEVMVIADEFANPAFIAADLLAQAEHGPDSQVFLLCEQMTLAAAVQNELLKQFATLKRQNIIKKSLDLSAIILCEDIQEQVQIINSYAPEHLIINREDAKSWIKDIKTAGTIFLGPWGAETLGDYVTGSTHVLPTNGYARNYSGLSVIDFIRRFSVQSVQAQGVQRLGPAAMQLANLEGLDAHAAAVQIRLNVLGV